MKKDRLFTRAFRAALLAAALTAAGCGGNKQAAGGIKDILHSPMGRIVESIEAARDRIPGGKIVVYELSDISGVSVPEGKLVAERLTTRLARTGKFSVIERSRLEAALRELKLSASGALDEGTAARAGRLLGAEAAVTGTLTRLDGKFEINARAIDVNTGAILAAASEQVDEEDLRVQGTRPRHAAPQTPAAATPYAYAPAPVPQEPAAQPEPGPARELPAGWVEWPGWDGRYGGYAVRNGRLVYTLSARQHDERDFQKDGYYPGLLLARELKGSTWDVEIKADYFLRGAGGRWLDAYVWLGRADTRPSILSPGASFVLAGRRRGDTGYGSDDFHISRIPGDVRIFGSDVRCVRFTRKGTRFEAYVSSDCASFSRAYFADFPGAAGAGSQKIVLGGQSFAETGSYAEYEYIKFNGKPFF